MISILTAKDEFIYHEALVHPAASNTKAETALVVGGDDGCAVRELVKYANIKQICVVPSNIDSLDEVQSTPELAKLNLFAFEVKTVTVSTDIPDQTFDLIILDWSADIVGKFKEYHKMLSPKGIMVVSAGSLSHEPKLFWSALKDLIEAGFYVTPMHRCVGSLNGEWGFLLATKRPIKFVENFKILCYTMTKGILDFMMYMPPEFQPQDKDERSEDNERDAE